TRGVHAVHRGPGDGGQVGDPARGVGLHEGGTSGVPGFEGAEGVIGGGVAEEAHELDVLRVGVDHRPVLGAGGQQAVHEGVVVTGHAQVLALVVAEVHEELER